MPQNQVIISEEELTRVAMQISTASVLPMVLKSAIELDLLDIIAKAGPGASLSGAEISAELPATNPAVSTTVDRILRLLACHSIIDCSLYEGERRYRVAPLTKFFTKTEGSLASFCLMMQDKVHMECWNHLNDAVLNGGIPFNKAYGMTAMDYRGTDPRFNTIFNQSMSDHSIITMKKLLETYNGFEGLNSIVDVGGGTGAIVGMIVEKYPSIKGINFDLPHVIEDATDYPGVEHVSGDMFTSIPQADAIFIKSVLHNWSDEYCSKFLKNCYNALPENGKMIVVDCILPAEPDTSLATTRVARIDVVMLVHNPGGKERSPEEFEALAKGAGFKRFQVVCDVLYSNVMEFLKN